MTSVKAKLSVILKADDVVVAETEDAKLWQKILAAINAGNPGQELDSQPAESLENGSATRHGDGDSVPLDQLARQLGIPKELVQGACSPMKDAPYLHLDPHCWEIMKRHLPKRGPGAVSPIVASTTLLALWFGKVGLGNPTQAQAQAVLATINARDPNASRSIQNAPWLQSRPGGQTVLNPAQISKAVTLARSFCSKDWSSWKEAGN